jgi:hypothetical protein
MALSGKGLALAIVAFCVVSFVVGGFISPGLMGIAGLVAAGFVYWHFHQERMAGMDRLMHPQAKTYKLDVMRAWTAVKDGLEAVEFQVEGRLLKWVLEPDKNRLKIKGTFPVSREPKHGVIRSSTLKLLVTFSPTAQETKVEHGFEVATEFNWADCETLARNTTEAIDKMLREAESGGPK